METSEHSWVPLRGTARRMCPAHVSVAKVLNKSTRPSVATAIVEESDKQIAALSIWIGNILKVTCESFVFGDVRLAKGHIAVCMRCNIIKVVNLCNDRKSALSGFVGEHNCLTNLCEWTWKISQCGRHSKRESLLPSCDVIPKSCIQHRHKHRCH